MSSENAETARHACEQFRSKEAYFAELSFTGPFDIV